MGGGGGTTCFGVVLTWVREDSAILKWVQKVSNVEKEMRDVSEPQISHFAPHAPPVTGPYASWSERTTPGRDPGAGTVHVQRV